MAKDNVFYVRKEAASAIGSLAAVVNQNVVVDKLVSIWFFCLVTYPRYHFQTCIFILLMLSETYSSHSTNISARTQYGTSVGRQH